MLLPWLTESYSLLTHEDDPSVPQNHTHITFNLVQNATWSDGKTLTASDVASTFWVSIVMPWGTLIDTSSAE